MRRRSNHAFNGHTVCPLIAEPKPWEFDGDEKRRVPVIDPFDGRVIRYVGFKRCMSCTKPFWSEDVSRLRLCIRCKSYKSE